MLHQKLGTEKPATFNAFQEPMFFRDNNNLKDIKIVQMDDSIEEEKETFARKDPSYLIHLKLLAKYDEPFHYIYASSIKTLIYNRSHYPINIMYKDVTAFAQDTECMRREYHLVTQAGKKQIQDRLRLLGDFYNRALVMKYEYPVMLLTRNEQTIKRKLRRMRKMIAADASSDDSDEGSINFDSFSTLGFLNKLYVSSSQEEQSSSSQYYKRNSYGSSVHDVYENTDMIVEFQERAELVNLREQDVSHLICDVRDVDYQKTLECYEIIQQKQNKPSDFSNLQKILKKQVNPEGTIVISKPQKNIKEMLSMKPNHPDRERKREKKQKMRDKAQALLNRVKSHDYIDYSKYISQNTNVQFSDKRQDNRYE